MAAETKQRLIEAARILFWRHGYASTGMAQILKEADAGSGSLYYFFPTKEDLLLAVLDYYKTMLEPDVLRPVFERVSDPIERIFGVLDGYRRQLLETEFASGCPIGNLALEVSNALPGARQRVAENFSLWSEAVEACLHAAAGRLPPLDLGQLAMFLLITMEGAVMLARTYRAIGPFDAAVHQLRDYFERLLRDGSSWFSSPSERSER